MMPDTIWIAKYYGALVVILALALLLHKIWRIAKKQSRRSRVRPATGFGSYTIPSHPAELARYIQANLQKLRTAKQQGRRRPSQTNRWLDSLAYHIATHGLETSAMSVEAKFAALFVVNRKFHRGERARMEGRKAFLQRTIVVHHRAECAMKRPWNGRFTETIEVSYGIWSTHLPLRLLDQGHYERPGKPSAKTSVGQRRTNRVRR